MTTTTVSTVPWIIRSLPRLRTALFFRLRLRLQNTAELLNLDSLSHPGTNIGGGGHWAAFRGIYNDVLIEITDVVEKNLAALDCLVSQGYGGDYARKRIETSDGSFDSSGRVAYAESFISMEAKVHDHLPITPKALIKSLRSDHEVMRHHSYRFPVDQRSTKFWSLAHDSNRLLGM